MNTNIFTAIVDNKKQENVAAEAMRAAIVESIIYNTSTKQRVDEDSYSTMMITAETLINAKKIVMYIGTSKEEFSFYNNGEILKNLQKLFVKVIDFDAYYEDKDCYISDENAKFSGFCWKHNYNGRTTKCGMYCAIEEETAETATDKTTEEAHFECEGEECEW